MLYSCFFNSIGDSLLSYAIAYTNNATGFICHPGYHKWLKLFNGPPLLSEGKPDVLLGMTFEYHFIRDYKFIVPPITQLKPQKSHQIIIPHCSTPDKEYMYFQTLFNNPLVITQIPTNYGTQLITNDAEEIASYLINASVVVGGSTGLIVLAAMLGTQTIVIGEKWSTIDTFSQFTNVKCLYPMCNISRELLLNECQIATRKG